MSFIHVYLCALVACGVFGASIELSLDSLNDVVEKLENDLRVIDKKVDGLSEKEKFSENFDNKGSLPHIDLKASNLAASNVSELSVEIEERFRVMLAALRTVARPVEQEAVCTWSLGVATDTLTAPVKPYTAQVGGGLLTCKPDKDGWLTIIRRTDGTVDFARGWEDYKYSFGEPDGSFWLGLELVHHLTTSHRYQLQVVLKSFNNESKTASYDLFKIGSESEAYKLTVNGYNGTTGDGLRYHQNMKFSTTDVDNDQNPNQNCAEQNGRGGWWYKSCDSVCLTGYYYNSAIWGETGIEWSQYFKQASLKYAEMKIRPVV